MTLPFDTWVAPPTFLNLYGCASGFSWSDVTTFYPLDYFAELGTLPLGESLVEDGFHSNFCGSTNLESAACWWGF